MEGNIFVSSMEFLSENRISIITRWISAILVFVGFYIAIRIIERRIKSKILADSLESDEYANKIANLVGKVVFVTLMIFNFLATFQIVWFEVWALIWWLSLSIWFAMENIIGNMIAGILIITHKKIKIWQMVKLLWSMNVLWTIEEIHIRYTIIRLIDKTRLLVPSIVLSSTPIQTIKDNPLIRWEVELKVHRDNSIEVIKQLITQAINEQKWVTYPWLTSVFMGNFDMVWVVVKWSYFIERKIWKNAFVLNKKIYPRIIELFRKYGIKFTYPRMVVDIEE